MPLLLTLLLDLEREEDGVDEEEELFLWLLESPFLVEEEEREGLLECELLLLLTALLSEEVECLSVEAALLDGDRCRSVDTLFDGVEDREGLLDEREGLLDDRDGLLDDLELPVPLLELSLPPAVVLDSFEEAGE